MVLVCVISKLYAMETQLTV